MKLEWIILGLLSIAIFSCQSDPTNVPLFDKIDPAESGVLFNNSIPDSIDLNILNYEYIYNGGGVAIADFDNDGWSDLFFSGNLVPNSLYKNKGNFQFEDISQSAKIGADKSWCSGVAIVDINQDGFKDIYVCTTAPRDIKDRANLLFINKMPQTGKLEFEESAHAYGIADSSYSTNSAFFDYDNDGDLDLFFINNNMQESHKPTVYSYQKDLLSSDRVDKLFKNEWSSELGHPVFTDVSQTAGINKEGYSLGLNICDINQDGWKDIYVTNDFLSNDLLYINNQDGTFTNKAEDYLKHTCLSAMGNDIVDLNNDGLADILAVDMLPESNYRKKTLMGPTNYNAYRLNKKYNYMQQYIRNVLQINQGSFSGTEDVVFSERAMIAGIEATDWSWAPVVADFDRDGNRDVIITNGFPKDITDRDFMNYQASNYAYVAEHKLIKKIPEVKIPNYAYKNSGDAQFEDVTEDWGLNIPSFSNGAAYGDLDNDGDLDLVINNINDAAFIYKNTIQSGNYIQVALKGSAKNLAAVGTTIHYNSSSLKGVYEHSVSRGYLSAMDEKIFIGLGKDSLIDLQINWPDGKVSELKNQKANQVLQIDYNKIKKQEKQKENGAEETLFTPSEIAGDDKIIDLDYVDINHEPLLLHKFSQYGPGIAVGDLNGDGLDDYYITGSAGVKGALYTQDDAGDFSKSSIPIPVDSSREELSAVFFDVDLDGDQDLFISCGGNQFKKSDPLYKDVLLLNDNGTLKNISDQLNLPNLSSSCARIADVDQDGDLDVFVAGRVLPGEYPLPVSSYLLINNSTPEGVKLEVKTDEVAEGLNEVGLVCDALWSDYNSDGWPDLVLAGEWMPITIFENKNGQLKKAEGINGLNDNKGWWNSMASADFDQDGDFDYVVTNYGTNSSIRTSQDQPVEIIAKDFDENGSLDAIPFVYFKNRKGAFQKFSFHGRGDLGKELNRVKKQFTSHHKIGIAPVDSILSSAEQADAYTLQATTFETSYIENKGNGVFEISPLPLESQVAPGFGILAEDFDSDGLIDLLMIGNDYGVQPTLGRMDAMNGLFLKGDGKGKFTPVPLSESGFYVEGDAKALASIVVGEQRHVLASQNNDQLKAFAYGTKTSFFTPALDDFKISFQDKEGAVLSSKILYYGNGFLSQSSRKIAIPKGAKKAELVKFNGAKRAVAF